MTPIEITADKVNRTIGFNLTDEEIIDIFEQLGFDTENKNGEITVNVPSRRKDISIIKRSLISTYIYGYDDHQRYLYLKMLRFKTTLC